MSSLNTCLNKLFGSSLEQLILIYLQEENYVVNNIVSSFFRQMFSYQYDYESSKFPEIKSILELKNGNVVVGQTILNIYDKKINKFIYTLAVSGSAYFTSLVETNNILASGTSLGHIVLWNLNNAKPEKTYRDSDTDVAKIIKLPKLTKLIKMIFVKKHDILVIILKDSIFILKDMGDIMTKNVYKLLKYEYEYEVQGTPNLGYEDELKNEFINDIIQIGESDTFIIALNKEILVTTFDFINNKIKILNRPLKNLYKIDKILFHNNKLMIKYSRNVVEIYSANNYLSFNLVKTFSPTSKIADICFTRSGYMVVFFVYGNFIIFDLLNSRDKSVIISKGAKINYVHQSNHNIYIGDDFGEMLILKEEGSDVSPKTQSKPQINNLSWFDRFCDLFV